RYLASLGNLCLASKIVLLLRNSAEPARWKKMGEWAATGGTSRFLVAFSSQLDQIAERSVRDGPVMFPLEPTPARGTGHYLLATRLKLLRADEECVTACLLSEVNE